MKHKPSIVIVKFSDHVEYRYQRSYPSGEGYDIWLFVGDAYRNSMPVKKVGHRKTQLRAERFVTRLNNAERIIE